MAKKPALSLTIIILSFNSSFWLKKTLQSLFEFVVSSSRYPIKVVLVDNNSEDDSVSMTKNLFPEVEIIQLHENNGFAVGNNQALQHVDTTFVMLLNSDMECTPSTNIDVLLEFARDNPRTAVVSPKIIFKNGSLDRACHRGEPTVWNSLCYFSGLSQLFPQSELFAQYHQSYKDLSTIHTVDACSGAAMIVRTEAIHTVGLLDERFFMYAEDLDWCKRFRDAGYLVVYHPGAEIIHHKYKSGIKGTSKKLARETKQYFYTTMLQYYDKHYGHRYPAFVRWIIQGVLFIKKGAL